MPAPVLFTPAVHASLCAWQIPACYHEAIALALGWILREKNAAASGVPFPLGGLRLEFGLRPIHRFWRAETVRLAGGHVWTPCWD
jgi:hypothetical protein